MGTVPEHLTTTVLVEYQRFDRLHRPVGGSEETAGVEKTGKL